MIVVSENNGQQGYRYFRPLRRLTGDRELRVMRMPSLRAMQFLAWLSLAICAVPLLLSWSDLARRHPMIDEWVCWSVWLLLASLLLWQLGGLLPVRRMTLAPPLQIYSAPEWLSGGHVTFWLAASTSFNMLGVHQHGAHDPVWRAVGCLCMLVALLLMVDGWRIARHTRDDLA